MLFHYMGYFFVSICSLYICNKLFHSKTKQVLQSLFTLCYSILTSYVSFIATKQNEAVGVFIAFILCLFFNLLIYNLNSYIIFISSIISFGLSYAFIIISNLFVSLCTLLIYKESSSVPYIYFYFPIGLLQFIFIFLVFRTNRITNGIRQIILSHHFHVGTNISFFIISLTIFIVINKHSFTYGIRTIINLFLISISALLLYYWRHRITQTYRESMRRLETLNYENTIADKDKHIKELENQNAYLGRIIHKYRKTIPAIELSVLELLQNNEELDTTELKQKAKSLQIQLDEIHAERDSLFDNFQKQTIASTQTGLHTVDAMLALMEKRAKQDWIRYKMQIASDIKELSLNSIKETDLLHLLGDLIENAIHAVNVTYTKDILIHIGKLNNCLLFEISDSGVPFDIPTYQNFGTEAYTTHQEDGGTGTGLLDIWSIKKKYKASLYIYEYESSSNVYTKKISFLFDGKNHFLLKTYRDKEIKNFLIRGDLHVFPHETE